MDNNEPTSFETFLFWNDSGKINPSRLYDFFSANGFGKYYPDPSRRKHADPVIVKITGNLVSQVSVNYLLEFTKDYIILKNTDEAIKGSILDSLHTSTSLFGDKNIKLLRTLELQFLSDKIGTGYLFFRNGVLEVTGTNLALRPFSDFSEYIWETSVIPHDFSIVEFSALKDNSDFMKFLIDLSTHEDQAKALSRLQSLQSAIGYLLHRHKNPATTKAIILMDTYVNGLPNGGSGKTLLINAIGKIRKLAIVDGKMYDQKEWFALSSVELDTEVLLFDDVDVMFDFEKIFPLMTTGLQIRRKYKDHVYLPFDKSPKVALTTNYAILGDSSSHRRRKFEFEVTATFSADFTPRDKFGKNFFDGWEDQDWNYFFNTMIQCLQVFLQNGLIQSEPLNLQLTKLISKTNEDFPDWAKEYIQLNEKYDKRRLYERFIAVFPEYSRISQRDFTMWLRAWGAFIQCTVNEPHSDTTRYIIFESINQAQVIEIE